MGDPNNIKRTVDGAVYARYTWDDAVYAATSGPRLSIRIRISSANHFARKAEAAEDKYASAAAKKASSKGKKKKRATTT